MAQRFGVTSSTTFRTATPTLGITPLARRCTRSERVHRLRIGCSTHAHKHNRGERLDATLTLTNSARNSLATGLCSTPQTAEFQRSNFNS